MYNVSHKVDLIQCLKTKNNNGQCKKKKEMTKITAAHLLSGRKNVT